MSLSPPDGKTKKGDSIYMKKFFGEFKKFITRGNVMDMAVGVIVGSAFTAIVNALSNNILKPVINYLLALVFGKNSLSELFTFLKRVDTLDEAGNVVLNEAGLPVPDLAQSIYIDWGAFINAIINFFLSAFVLFCIVKAFNSVREGRKNILDRASELASEDKLSRADRKAMKAAGVNYKDKAAVAAWYAAAAQAEADAKAEAEAKALAERLANPTTEDLLKSILAELQKK